PSGDLAAFVLHHGIRPRNVFDTQVAAGFAGYGGSPSLERLLEQAVNVRLRHDEGFTDWSKRPLTPVQIEYAADDVRHLLAAAGAWREREARRRDLPASWLIKDATLIEVARRRPKTARDAESIRGLQLRKGAQLDGLLAAVAGAGAAPAGAPEGDLPGEVR